MKSRKPQSSGLSERSALALKPILEAFESAAPYAERILFDSVEFPRRYKNARDIEVAGLLSACLAYGRADLFKPKLQGLFAQMGQSPADFVRSLNVPATKRLLEGFVYRFNVGTDLAVLLWGMKGALERLGSLEALFRQGLERGGGLHGALAHFTASLREVPMVPLRKALGPERGLHHLLPSPLGPGAAKRLNLFLRWMVRGPDAVDLGVWRQVPPSVLLIPLDTHIARMAKNLGLTRRNDLSWKTAEEITASLRRLDPKDPVRFDFALCHFGMSGLCPAQPKKEHCSICALRGVCLTGPRIMGFHKKVLT